MPTTDQLTLARLATSQAIVRGEVTMPLTRDGISDESIAVFDRSLDHVFQPNVRDRIILKDSIVGLLLERTEAERAVNQKREQFPGFGSPTSEFSVGRDGRGYYRHYQGGSVFWLPMWGAHEIHGAIRDKFAMLGWEMSYLGYPTTDEISSNTGVRYSNFEHGSLEWTMEHGVSTPLAISVKPEKHQLGYWLEISGTGFTPGSGIRGQVEGLEGAVGAKTIGMVETARPDGRFGPFTWDGRTWPRGGTAVLRVIDQATGRSTTSPIPALY